jgi:RNA polymerase sigma factor (sigma-70 family)
VPATMPASAEALAERLYAAHRQRLLAIARRNCGSGDEAEEALQDALILFIEHFDPAGESPPLPWLTLTLKRRCWALYARRRKGARPIGHGRLERVADLGARAPQELCEVSEEVARLAHDLAELTADERRALALLALGYSYREIGEACNWTYTKVNRCLAEGRARLRRLADAAEAEPAG